MARHHRYDTQMICDFVEQLLIETLFDYEKCGGVLHVPNTTAAHR